MAAGTDPTPGRSCPGVRSAERRLFPQAWIRMSWSRASLMDSARVEPVANRPTPGPWTTTSTGTPGARAATALAALRRAAARPPLPPGPATWTRTPREASAPGLAFGNSGSGMRSPSTSTGPTFGPGKTCGCYPVACYAGDGLVRATGLIVPAWRPAAWRRVRWRTAGPPHS